jgi:hypothetical protein
MAATGRQEKFRQGRKAAIQGRGRSADPEHLARLIPPTRDFAAGHRYQTHIRSRLAVTGSIVQLGVLTALPSEFYVCSHAIRHPIPGAR